MIPTKYLRKNLCLNYYYIHDNVTCSAAMRGGDLGVRILILYGLQFIYLLFFNHTVYYNS